MGMGGNSVMDVVMQRLLALRKQKKLTQGQVAQYSNVAQSTISSIELGKIQPKTVDALVNLASFYGVTLEYLFGFVDDPNAKIMESFEFRSAVEPEPATLKAPAYGSILTAEERWLALFRQLPADEQRALLQTMEQYLAMDDDQRAIVDRMMAQFKRLMTPRIIGGEE